MTDDNDTLRTVLTVVGVLLAIPLFMMGIMMPLMVVTMGGTMSVISGGPLMLLPVIPLALLGALVYLLYRYTMDRDQDRQEPDDALEGLRVSYARGELSDEEFQNRRQRLETHPNATSEAEEPRHA